MKVLLDTNAYTALFRGHAGVAKCVRSADQVLMSTVVAGELLFGFRNGSRFETNREELEDFLASPYVALLPVTLVTADRFGRIAASLRRKGRPLPTNDIWIAAHAMESGADLLSFDQHFDEVDGIAWIQPDV
ncbi:MAG: type II toxin-antitoxin system VapC family toxin [Acidobacteriota bacterium]